MTNNDSRTGSFWDRHNKLMQDPEHEARFNTELARIRAVDAEVNANDLRTALTKLADKWNNQAGARDPEEEVRALLAAHPAATETVVDDIMRDLKAEADFATFEGGDFPVYAVPMYVVEETLAARLRGATR